MGNIQLSNVIISDMGYLFVLFGFKVYQLSHAFCSIFGKGIVEQGDTYNYKCTKKHEKSINAFSG